MIRFVIHNKSSKSYLGIKSIDGVKKYGFYKSNNTNFDVLTFESLNTANFIAQLLYDLKGYKSLVVTEIQV